MSTHRFAYRIRLVGITAAIATIAAFFTPAVRAGDCCSSRKSSSRHDHGTREARHEHPSHRHTQAPAASIATLPSHGGQIHAANFQRFEVVYLPYETRVYLYGADGRPLSPRAAEGRVTMRVRGNPQVYRYALRPVAATSGQHREEFLVAAVDVSRIRDGDMTVAFDLRGLPAEQERQVSFTRTFALTESRPNVAVVALTESDHAAISRQGVCPVTGGRLGSMGAPVKLLVADQPMYLCCQGCIEKVRENPDRYVVNATSVREQSAQRETGQELTVKHLAKLRQEAAR